MRFTSSLTRCLSSFLLSYHNLVLHFFCPSPLQPSFQIFLNILVRLHYDQRVCYFWNAFELNIIRISLALIGQRPYTNGKQRPVLRVFPLICITRFRLSLDYIKISTISEFVNNRIIYTELPTKIFKFFAIIKFIQTSLDEFTWIVWFFIKIYKAMLSWLFLCN